MKQTLTNAGVFINGFDQSNYVQTLQVVSQRDEADITGIGSEYRETWPDNDSLSIDLDMLWGNQTVDEILRDAHQAGTSITVQIQPSYGGISSTNPMWEADCVVVHYTALGDVGAATPTSVSLRATGEYALLDADRILFLPWGVSVVGT